MSLVEFLQDLCFKGVKLGNDKEKLRIGGSKSLLTPDVVARLQQHKTEILQLLRDRPHILNIHPLSYGQQALWFLWQLAPKSAAYNMSFTCRICSQVNVATLQKTFQFLINRHPQLRSTFCKQGNQVVQQIHQTQLLNFQQINACSWSQQQLEQRVFQEYKQFFDLENGPVIRVRLFTCSPEEHILLISVHHIANDTWSMALLMEELITSYPALESGVQPSLTPLKHSYIDYIRWQKQLLTTVQGEKLWQYWQQQLSGELPILNLPTDKPRPPSQTYNGASHNFDLSPKLTEKLKKLAQTADVTLYILLLAIYQVLLYRYTGQEDILVGVPTSGRTQIEFASTVGYFVNLVVTRANLSGNPSFAEFLAQVRHTVSQALAHQDFPFALLVERLQPQRDFSRSPIFQTVFNFILQNLGQFEHTQQLLLAGEVNQAGFILKPFKIPQIGCLFDLDLVITEASSALVGVFKYNTDLFDASTIERMAGHFMTLLEAIVANPQQCISQLPLLTKTEQQQLLIWNQNEADDSENKCIHQLFEEQVQRTPNAVAVVFENQQLTYHQLNCQANQLAHYLRSLGVKPDVLVGICVERSLEMVVGLLAILKAGGAYVPLDFDYPRERLSLMLEDAEVSLLVTQQRLIDRLPEYQVKLVCLDEIWEQIAQNNQANLTSEVKADHLANVIYTSGSTGKPKGVMVEHKGLYNLAQAQIQTFNLRCDSRVLQFASLSFDASISEILMALGSGARLYLATKASLLPGKLLIEQLRHHGITHVTLPPSMLAVMPLEELPTLQTIIVAGEACCVELVKRWSVGRNFFNAYGPTEASVCTAIAKCTVEDEKISIGRAIANTQIYILDSHLQPVGVGVVGELHIAGLGLARGYLNRPELTKEKFITNPFDNTGESKLYKTGDLARYLNDGNIEYLGRIDNQVKIRGFRIELGEIEAILSQHSDVQACCVIAREDIPGDQRLVAYMVLHQHCTPKISELRKFFKAKLPEYMIPNAFVILESLPLTFNGKVDRRALPAPDIHINDSGTFVTPRNQLELQLTQIWSKVLRVDNVGVKDNFFDLGGYSLLIPYLMTLIKQQFGKDIAIASLYQNPTIEQLATIVQADSNFSISSFLVAIQPQGSKPPLFFLPGATGNPFYLYNLTRCLGQDQPFYSFQTNNLSGESKPLTQVEDIASQYIEAIKVIQPHGPYFLAGHSFGGKLAFEMAQQLLCRGHQVGLVAIVDSTAPYYQEKPIGFDWGNAKWLAQLANTIEIVYATKLDISVDILQSLLWEEQLKYVLQSLKRVNILPPDAEIMQLNNMVEILKANSLVNYLPREVYPTQITLLRAIETYAVEEHNSELLAEILQDSAWGWSKFSTKPVDIHFVPGNHITMMTQPHVQVLAEQLKVCIEQS